MAGSRVVELGAGPGLPGLYAAASGAHVCISDLAKVVPLIRENIIANAHTVQLVEPPAAAPRNRDVHQGSPADLRVGARRGAQAASNAGQCNDEAPGRMHGDPPTTERTDPALKADPMPSSAAVISARRHRRRRGHVVPPEACR